MCPIGFSELTGLSTQRRSAWPMALEHRLLYFLGR